MKLTKRPAAARGQAELGWLHSRHTFSFGEYRDPAHMGFRKLRVINDDIVEPGQGFGTHGHKDAEILSYVLEGRLEHKDSMGNGSIIETGALQYMSAGSGVTHSEFNPSRNERVHFLQIWILPDGSGGEPRYAEKQLPSETSPNSLTLVFSGQPRDGAIGIRADADVFLGRLDAGRKLVHETRPGRGVWIHVVAGDVKVGGTPLAAGDGAAVEDATKLDLESADGAELLLFDLR
ncbi:pirin family protein [Myxococcota bacterium]|nr:pirin family protein [Myxococcota bacterium]